MGQRQGVYKPNKLELKIQNEVSYFLKCRGSKKRAHWKAVNKEAALRTKEVVLFAAQMDRAERMEEV